MKVSNIYNSSLFHSMQSIVGTIAYIAPEVALARQTPAHYDFKADAFSTGATIFSM